MNNKDFKPGQVVLYLPSHVNGDETHPDCEWGIVSSILPGGVAVKFARQLARLGWDDTTSQTCDAQDLIHKPLIHREHLPQLQNQRDEHRLKGTDQDEDENEI